MLHEQYTGFRHTQIYKNSSFVDVVTLVHVHGPLEFNIVKGLLKSYLGKCLLQIQKGDGIKSTIFYMFLQIVEYLFTSLVNPTCIYHGKR